MNKKNHLFQACKAGDFKKVHELLYKKFLFKLNVNAISKDWGKRPIHFATEMGHKKIVEILIEKGAWIDVKDSTGATPLYIAIEKGHKDIVKLLISKGVNIDPPEKLFYRSPLQKAIIAGKKEIVELLIEKGASVDAKWMGKQTALHVASIEGKVNIVKLLIEKKAWCDFKDDKDLTALDYALEKSDKAHIEIAELLTKECAISSKDTFSTRDSIKKPLMEIIQNNLKTPDKLVGVRLNCKTVNGWQKAIVMEATESYIMFQFDDGSFVPNIHWSLFLADIKDGNITSI